MQPGASLANKTIVLYSNDKELNTCHPSSGLSLGSFSFKTLGVGDLCTMTNVSEKAVYEVRLLKK